MGNMNYSGLALFFQLFIYGFTPADHFVQLARLFFDCFWPGVKPIETNPC